MFPKQCNKYKYFPLTVGHQHVYTYGHIYICIYSHRYVETHTHIYIYVYVYVYAYMYICNVYIYICMYNPVSKDPMKGHVNVGNADECIPKPARDSL